MKVIKKDGTLEAFDGQKIVNAVTKSASRVMVNITDSEFRECSGKELTLNCHSHYSGKGA